MSNDNKAIAVGYANGAVAIFDICGNQLLEFQAHDEKITSVAFSHKQDFLVTTSIDKKAKIWSFRNSECIATLNAYAHYLDHDQSSRSHAKISKDDKYIYLISDWSRVVRIYNRFGRHVLDLNYRNKPNKYACDNLTNLFIYDDSKTISTVSASGKIKTFILYKKRRGPKAPIS